MKYRDRLGNEYEHTTEQDRFLADAYESVVGRALMKFLCNPVFSKVGRIVLESELSAKAVKWFADKNNIDMSEYEDKEYVSFNDFFTRKIKADKRFVTKDDNILISPSDGKVSAYRITADSRFTVKNSVYSVASLLRDSKLAKRYDSITLSDEELCKEANKWELSHGGISGRTAQQFINYLAGKEKEEA